MDIFGDSILIRIGFLYVLVKATIDIYFIFQDYFKKTDLKGLFGFLIFLVFILYAVFFVQGGISAVYGLFELYGAGSYAGILGLLTLPLGYHLMKLIAFREGKITNFKQAEKHKGNRLAGVFLYPMGSFLLFMISFLLIQLIRNYI